VDYLQHVKEANAGNSFNLFTFILIF
jgi:integrase